MYVCIKLTPYLLSASCLYTEDLPAFKACFAREPAILPLWLG